MLEGYENVWHENSTAMALNVRFYNSSGDQIGRNIYSVIGEKHRMDRLVEKFPH